MRAHTVETSPPPLEGSSWGMQPVTEQGLTLLHAYLCPVQSTLDDMDMEDDMKTLVSDEIKKFRQSYEVGGVSWTQGWEGVGQVHSAGHLGICTYMYVQHRCTQIQHIYANVHVHKHTYMC